MQTQVIEISEFGAPDVLRPATRAIPAPGDGEVLIRVSAAGINRPDILQRRGMYPPPTGAPDTPGLEVAGIIQAIGKNVSGVKLGDRVMALVPGGGYAQHSIAPQETLMPIPDKMSFIEAAAIPETFFTVWSNVFMRGALQAGETLLVHGGASGIGTTAIKLGKAFGAKVIVTAGDDQKCQFCRDLGADVAINYKDDVFEDAVLMATDGKGADVILDMVAGDYIPRDIACMNDDGRLVIIAFLGGVNASLNLTPIMMKRLTITGSTLRARPLSFKKSVRDALMQHVWPLLEAGRISPVIDRVFPMHDAAHAHAYMDSGQHMGKIVLEMTA